MEEGRELQPFSFKEKLGNSFRGLAGWLERNSSKKFGERLTSLSLPEGEIEISTHIGPGLASVLRWAGGKVKG